MRRWVLSDERGGERGERPRQFSNLVCLWLDFHWLTGHYPLSGIGGYNYLFLEDFGFDIKFLVFIVDSFTT